MAECLDVSGHKFLGATIIGINSSLGWGSNGTSLTVSLVEDTCNGDNFNPPILGSPVCVNVGNGEWNFGGFLDSWEFKSSVSAGHTFDAKIIDPTQLLENYQCILANYDGGVFGVPNLGNVFGYLENSFLSDSCIDYMNGDRTGVNYTPAFGFGGSHINAGGIPVTLVLEALDQILNGLGGDFGTYPYYRNTEYKVDLSQLLNLPVYSKYYRIGGDSSNLLGIIDTICKDSGFDYYCELGRSTRSGGGDVSASGCPVGGEVWTVIIRPVPINNFGGFAGARIIDVQEGDVDAGDIAKALGTGVEYSQKSIGLDHRGGKETLNSFTVGDNFQGIHQAARVPTCHPSTATIWPYWGDDWTGAPILGVGCDDFHGFWADSREWNVRGVGAFYYITIAEIRAALSKLGEAGWRSWIALWKQPLWETMLGDNADFNFNNLIGQIRKPPKANQLKDPERAEQLRGDARRDGQTDAHKNITNLFNAVKSIAEEYFGKKYMVSIPFVCTYTEDETGELKQNWERTESGWSSAGVNVIGLGNPTPGLQIFKDEAGKITAFVRYDSANLLDPTKLVKGDYYYESGYLWIKASVEKLVRSGGKFFAVIELKTPIFLGIGVATRSFDDFFVRLLADAQAQGRINEDQATSFKAQAIKWGNGKILQVEDGPIAVIPDAAAIPLKSNKVSYGPWYGGYLGGPTDYVRETTFNPWNFGSTAMMQLAGSIHTVLKITTEEVAESGSVTIPGYPIARLGQRVSDIVASGTLYGPIITDIAVTHGISGVTTTYQFKTFSNKWGQLSKKILDGMQRRAQGVQKNNERLLHRLLEPDPPNSPIYRMRAMGTGKKAADKDEADHPGSPSDMIFSNSSYYVESDWPLDDWLPLGAGDSTRGSCDLVVGKWAKDFAMRGGLKDWASVAGVEPMGIFRPFATEDNAVMSNYKEISQQSWNASEALEKTTFSEGRAYTNKFYSRAPIPPVYDEYNMPITITTMNPFKGGNTNTPLYQYDYMNESDSGRHDIDFIVRDNTFPAGARISTDSGLADYNYRAISLRGPILITGWGFDIGGKPVPAAPIESGKRARFADDWLKKPADWKTGALDVRWDEDRGLWVPPPSFEIVRAKACQALGPKYDANGWFELLPDDTSGAELQKDSLNKNVGETGDDIPPTPPNCVCTEDSANQVMAFNKTGKVILGNAEVLLYFDTRHHKYYVTTTTDPIVVAYMDDIMPHSESGMATIDPSRGHLQNLGSGSGAGTGSYSPECGNTIKITNTLKQPIYVNKIVFVYLTDVNDDYVEGGTDSDYNDSNEEETDSNENSNKFVGEVIQAEFAWLTVVVSVDCYGDPPVLEICDRRISLQTAWTIQDCGLDSPLVKDDTVGWRPKIHPDEDKDETPYKALEGKEGEE